MENHKIDRLFQDKLSRHEIDPSTQAWEAINAKLNKEKRPMIWLSIAASVLVLAVAAWLLYPKGNEIASGTQAYITPDYPKMESPIEWNLPVQQQDEPAQLKKSTKESTNKNRIPVQNVEANQNDLKLVAKTIEVHLVEFIPEFEAVGLDAVASSALEIREELDITPIAAPPGVSVQITYKATPPAPVEEKSRIERLWSKAKEIKPGEVLADLRETKNDFFNGKKN